MMKRFSLIFWLIVSIVFIGCQSHSGIEEEDIIESVFEEPLGYDETSVEDIYFIDDEIDFGAPLFLNDEEKWSVNDEMKPHIEEAEKILSIYVQNQSTDYLTLAEKLKEENAALIKSCTIGGKGQDELHKWLHPHIDLLGELGVAKSEKEANDIIQEILISFEVYHLFFE